MPSTFEVGKILRVQLWENKKHDLQIHFDRNLQEIEGNNIFTYTRNFYRLGTADLKELAKLIVGANFQVILTS